MADWNPWQEMNRLRHEIDRAFEQVGWRNGGRIGRTFPTAFLPGHAARAYPLVNVSEDANALYVTALAPGLDPTAIQLTVQDNRLTIAGEKQRIAAEIQPDRRLDSRHVILRKARSRQRLEAGGDSSATAHHPKIAQGLSAQALHRRHVKSMSHAHHHHTGVRGEI